MKRFISILLSIVMIAIAFTACGGEQSSGGAEVTYTGIQLSDDGVLVGGEAASTDSSSAVYVSNDIIFYLEGQGPAYGEGESSEEHSQAEADKHTVINITQPGNYTFTGSISYGQIAVNLGKDAKKDPNAVVNIILDNVDLTSTVAPAIVCYKAYECGSDDVEKAVKDVDISGAGFNITIADGSVNNINGGHVAKIYKEGTTDKLHKYDAAIESMVSFNIYGNDGVLNVNADNEGIETKMHLTIHGGEINIASADDSLNAGEDGVSVITINDGVVVADSNGGAEGDGIDSNGWLVINGGYVSAFGNSKSMDSGLDSDNGIHINGGVVFATGNMYDDIAQESKQNFAVFNFAQAPEKGKFVVMKSNDSAVVALESRAQGTNWIYSSPMLTEGEYTMYKAGAVTGEGFNGIYADITAVENETQLAYSSVGSMGQRPGMMVNWNGGFDGQMPEGFDKNNQPDFGQNGNMPGDFDFSQMPQNGGRPNGRNMPNMPYDGQMPENGQRPGGVKPNGGFGSQMPQGFDKNNQPDFSQNRDMPNNFDFGNMPEDFNFGGMTGGFAGTAGELQTVFTVVKGANIFSGITEYVQA